MSYRLKISLTFLEIIPSLHSDLAAIEFSFVFNTSLLGLFSSGLSSVSPREVIELPVCIGRKHKIPNWQREQVYQHPDDI
jgi:hypothetical protein